MLELLHDHALGYVHHTIQGHDKGFLVIIELVCLAFDNIAKGDKQVHWTEVLVPFIWLCLHEFEDGVLEPLCCLTHVLVFDDIDADRLDAILDLIILA